MKLCNFANQSHSFAQIWLPSIPMDSLCSGKGNKGVLKRILKKNLTIFFSSVNLNVCQYDKMSIWTNVYPNKRLSRPVSFRTWMFKYDWPKHITISAWVLCLFQNLTRLKSIESKTARNMLLRWALLKLKVFLLQSIPKLQWILKLKSIPKLEWIFKHKLILKLQSVQKLQSILELQSILKLKSILKLDHS